MIIADWHPPRNFSDNIVRLENLSVTRRPGAINFDGLTAFDLGPDYIQHQDASMYTHQWKIRADSGNVYICRSSDDYAIWEAESILFTYTGTIADISFTFDQNRYIIVSYLLNGSLYIYWYNTGTESYTSINIPGNFKSPRIRIDNRRDINLPASDVLLFYVNSEDTICYRKQNEDFSIEYELGITKEYMYIEEVCETADNRLVVFYSYLSDGLYIMDKAYSDPYPFGVNENTSMDINNISGNKLEIIHTISLNENLLYEINNITGYKEIYDPWKEILIEDAEKINFDISNIEGYKIYYSPWIEKTIEETESIVSDINNINGYKYIAIKEHTQTETDNMVVDIGDVNGYKESV